MWYYVRPGCRAFLENLKITEDQANVVENRHRGVVSCLIRGYWNSSDTSMNRILIGSWGKFTRVRPPRDVDILFALPAGVTVIRAKLGQSAVATLAGSEVLASGYISADRRSRGRARSRGAIRFVQGGGGTCFPVPGRWLPRMRHPRRGESLRARHDQRLPEG